MNQSKSKPGRPCPVRGLDDPALMRRVTTTYRKVFTMSTTINERTLTRSRFSDELARCRIEPTAESGRFRVRIDIDADPDPYVEELGLADLRGWRFVQASMLRVGAWIEYRDDEGRIRIERIA